MNIHGRKEQTGKGAWITKKIGHIPEGSLGFAGPVQYFLPWGVSNGNWKKKQQKLPKKKKEHLIHITKCIMLDRALFSKDILL